MNPVFTKNVARAFSYSAHCYDRFARVQLQAADLLTSKLSQVGVQIPDGPVLEIGCGTGFFTRSLVTNYRSRPLTITDLSPNMVALCKRAIENDLSALPQNLIFSVLDGQVVHVPNTYALIASSFVLQWFPNLNVVLQHLVESLLVNGVLLCSFPIEGSFAEWSDVATGTNIDVLPNPFPKLSELTSLINNRSLETQVETIELVDSYDNALSFFKSLKGMGAHSTISSPWTESRFALRRLIKQWDRLANGNIRITYKIALLTVVRRA